MPWKSYQKAIEIHLYIYNLFMFKTFSDNELVSKLLKGILWLLACVLLNPISKTNFAVQHNKMKETLKRQPEVSPMIIISTR